MLVTDAWLDYYRMSIKIWHNGCQGGWKIDIFIELASQFFSSWNQLGDDIDGEARGDQSGFLVALSSDGSTVAIGAMYNDGNVSFNGHVRIFEWNNETWKQLGDDIDGKAVLDHSGFSVALSSDGSTVAIGAPRNKDDSNVFTSNVGHVRVYNMDEVNSK
jgi:hypothetical protein